MIAPADPPATAAIGYEFEFGIAAKNNEVSKPQLIASKQALLLLRMET